VARPEHRYQAFGLRIHSALELPELAQARSDGAQADVTVGLGEVGEIPGGDGDWVRWDTRPDRVRMCYAGVCRIDVRGGSEIVVEELADPETAHIYVVGPALAMALAQRGDHVLHASAVAIEGRAVAFAGFSGGGKSTLAAALHERGFPLVADDVVAVRVRDGRAIAVPGYPQQKLWPSAAGALGLEVERMPRIYPQIEKRVRRVPEDFDTSALPLAVVLVLDEGEEVALEPLGGGAAALELVRHSYDLPATQAFSAPANLEAAARVAEAVPVVRLRRPWRLDALDETIDAIVTAGSGTEVPA
jgi:hypothetical protein